MGLPNMLSVTMRGIFLADTRGHLRSEMAPENTENALRVGDRLVISRPIDLGYMAQVLAGELGTVVYVEPTQGGVEVLLDTIHRGLHAWHNCLLLVPFMTDDTLDAYCLIVA